MLKNELNRKFVSKYYDLVDVKKPWDVYPRPSLKRDSFINLNGLWDYAITDSDQKPVNYNGQILVPFSPETILSGVMEKIYPSDYLWYRKKINIKFNPDERVILHFGAVDQIAEVSINSMVFGKHKFGFTPFSFDITQSLVDGENEILVLCKDFADSSYFARGKQTLKPKGIWYPNQSGIWQTVWIEIVPNNYIKSVKFNCDFDFKKVDMKIVGVKEGVFTVLSDGKEIISSTFTDGFASFVLEDMKPWSPENPHLYDVVIKTSADEVSTYFAMRKVSQEKDHRNVNRFMLNNKAYKQVGILDQGMWPESFLTPPCEQAIIDDIKFAKDMGFNMIRKHAKIEVELFYYYCDKMGMLVWQDIVNGGDKYDIYLYRIAIAAYFGINIKDDKYFMFNRYEQRSRDMYEQELIDTVMHLKNHPCIVTWTAFNEGWGQFDSRKAANLIRSKDSSRLIDAASGWPDNKAGDFYSRHFYFKNAYISKSDARIRVVSEFGGIGYKVENHFVPDIKIFQYSRASSKDTLLKKYRKCINSNIKSNIDRGIDAMVYTQLSDVEGEVNGLITYDRKYVKVDISAIREINTNIWGAPVNGKEE